MLLAAITERTATLRTVVRHRLNAKQFNTFLEPHSTVTNARELTPALLRRKGQFRKVGYYKE